jgi:CO/xanthine dehydrogenase FAD-binding subunit
MFDNVTKFVDVSGIEELKVKSFDGKTVVLGAALTITEAQEYLKTICEKTGFNYLREMIKQMDSIGNLSIRNVFDKLITHLIRKFTDFFN